MTENNNNNPLDDMFERAQKQALESSNVKPKKRTKIKPKTTDSATVNKRHVKHSNASEKAKGINRQERADPNKPITPPNAKVKSNPIEALAQIDPEFFDPTEPFYDLPFEEFCTRVAVEGESYALVFMDVFNAHSGATSSQSAEVYSKQIMFNQFIQERVTFLSNKMASKSTKDKLNKLYAEVDVQELEISDAQIRKRLRNRLAGIVTSGTASELVRAYPKILEMFGMAESEIASGKLGHVDPAIIFEYLGQADSMDAGSTSRLVGELSYSLGWIIDHSGLTVAEIKHIMDAELDKRKVPNDVGTTLVEPVSTPL